MKRLDGAVDYSFNKIHMPSSREKSVINLVKTTDANGHSTTYAYDAADRMVSQTATLSKQRTHSEM